MMERWKAYAMTNPDRVKRILSKFLAQSGQSMREVSLKAGTNPMLVRDIMAGKAKKPRPATLLRLATVMGIPVNDLADESCVEPQFGGGDGGGLGGGSSGRLVRIRQTKIGLDDDNEFQRFEDTGRAPIGL